MTEVENIVFVVGYGNDIKWFGMPLIKNAKPVPIDGVHRKSVFAEYADGTRELKIKWESYGVNYYV